MKKKYLSTRQITIFSMFAVLMFITTALVKLIPNIHLLGLYTGVCTLQFRERALFPLYVNIFLYGLLKGFAVSWLPYLYIWLPLWLAFMLIGKMNFQKKVQVPLHMLICGLHGLTFGIMYAPAQAIMYGLNFESTVAWIIAGFPFDIIHAMGNVVAATLITPLFIFGEKMDR